MSYSTEKMKELLSLRIKKNEVLSSIADQARVLQEINEKVDGILDLNTDIWHDFEFFFYPRGHHEEVTAFELIHETLKAGEGCLKELEDKVNNGNDNGKDYLDKKYGVLVRKCGATVHEIIIGDDIIDDLINGEIKKHNLEDMITFEINETFRKEAAQEVRNLAKKYDLIFDEDDVFTEISF